jgi:hypothetical protein
VASNGITGLVEDNKCHSLGSISIEPMRRVIRDAVATDLSMPPIQCYSASVEGLIALTRALTGARSRTSTKTMREALEEMRSHCYVPHAQLLTGRIVR